MKEKWKPIKGYEHIYAVSNDGRVKNLKTGRIIKPFINNKGYVMIQLHKNGIRKLYLTHRLVAEAFISNPNNYPCINHKNEIKTDNNILNLEWVTYSQNMLANGLSKRIAVKSAEKRKKPVRQLDKGIVIAIFPSVKDAAEALGVRHQSITDAIKKGHSCKNYKWQYD